MGPEWAPADEASSRMDVGENFGNSAIADGVHPEHSSADLAADGHRSASSGGLLPAVVAVTCDTRMSERPQDDSILNLESITGLSQLPDPKLTVTHVLGPGQRRLLLE